MSEEHPVLNVQQPINGLNKFKLKKYATVLNWLSGFTPKNHGDTISAGKFTVKISPVFFRESIANAYLKNQPDD